MATSLETVVKQLEDSGIMPTGKLENFVPPKAHPKDAEELIRELIKQAALTTFQAQHVLAGKAKALFLGNYTILDRIGAGGMGQVFKAEHRRMERIVAIKMLPAAMMKDDAALARFQREVKAAAKLEHPNIVAAYDADEANGVHFLVMQYVDGIDLSALVKKNGPIPVGQALNYIVQAARGLEFAHGEGIVHRDIKPSNLILDKKGAVRILDMGLARVDSPLGDTVNAGLTNTGNIMGTIDFMAPEQALDSKHADQRADIYSLGCTLFFLLTGKKMYDEDTVMKRLLGHREGAIPSLLAARPELPTGLQTVFQRFVAKRPADRYQSIGEARAALEAVQSGKSPLPIADGLPSIALPKGTAIRKPATQPQTSVGKRSRAPKQLPRGLMLGGAAVLLALGFGGYALRDLIFKHPPPAGTVMVEVDQPGAELTLDHEQKLSLRAGGQRETVEVSANSGKHLLEVRKDGFKIYTGEFVVNEGEPNRIKVRLEPLAAVTPDKAAGPSVVSAKPSPPASAADRERIAAEWVLKAGGELAVVDTDTSKEVFVDRLDKLPQQRFKVVDVNLAKDSVQHLQLTDSDLTKLVGLSGLARLNLSRVPLTDAGMKQIGRIASLKSINLHRTQISDAGLSELRNVIGLENLYLDSTKITGAGFSELKQLTGLQEIALGGSALVNDAGVKNLAAFTNLTMLTLNATQLTDEGVASLMPLIKLRSLFLHGTQISDHAIDTLRNLHELQNLELRSTRITDEGVSRLTTLTQLKTLGLQRTRISPETIRKLQLTLPNCAIDWSPATEAVAVLPSAPAASVAELPPIDPVVERRAAEWALSVGAKLFVRGPQGPPIEIVRVDQLPTLPVSVQAIEIRGNASVNDQSLAVVRGLNRLERLQVFETAITDRAMEHVHGLTNLTMLGVSVTKVGDPGIEQIADLPRLTAFYGNNNSTTDRGAQSLARSKSLRTLHLMRTQVTDAGLAHLARIPLSVLNVEYTSVGDAGLQHLQACDTLTELFLNSTRVSDAGLGFLAKMPLLRVLQLRACNITDRGVEKLAALKSLQNLAVTNTFISPEGHEKLQAALPHCKIEWSQREAAAVAAAPAAITPLDTSNRIAVPSTDDQQRALATLKGVFKDDFAAAKKPEDKVTLAEKLLKQAQESPDDPAACYALIGEARNLAIDTADAAVVVRLVGELGTRFNVDPLGLLADDLERSVQKSHPSSAFNGIAEAALDHVDEALEANHLPLAKRLSDLALVAARKAKDPTTLKTAIERNKSLAALKQQWDTAQDARTILAKTPDDAAANLALGRYLCFTKGAWAEGYTHLARGSDETLKELAVKSMATPQDAAGQAEQGEAWAMAADAAKGKPKSELQAGARYWYAMALPALSGLAKAKAEQRLKQLGPAVSAAAATPSRASRPRSANALEQLARDRKAAEWVLGLRGKVGIRVPWSPDEHEVERVADLPAQPFALTRIDLFQIKELTDDGMKNVEGLANLLDLRVEATDISDAGLEHLKDLSNLTTLWLNTTRVSDAGMIHVKGLKNLTKLVLGNRPPITDAALAQLKDLSNLTYLSLVNTSVTDDGLALLKSFPRLRVLQLNFVPITDAGLAHLQALPLLTELELSQTKVTENGLPKLYPLLNLQRLALRNLKLTDAAINQLQTALPGCKIQF
jgi:Leucine-rich repeat (LRR) protein/tRNA A-37 threonylcarbamoyl transferase component Bud32